MMWTHEQVTNLQSCVCVCADVELMKLIVGNFNSTQNKKEVLREGNGDRTRLGS